MSFRTSLSVEERLVLDSLAPWTDRVALPERVDPARLVALADRHRVAGSIEHRLASSGDGRPAGRDEALLALATRRDANVAAFLDQMCALVSVGRTLDRIGVEHVVLKGPALARLYRDETERHAGDLDILLREPADAERAIDALLEDRWRTDGKWIGWSSRRRRRHMDERKDLTLSRGVGFAPLDLHWRMFPSGRRVGSDDPFDRLVTRRAGGHRFPGLSDVDEAAYLLRHGTKHGWVRLKWLADIVHGDAALGREGAAAARALAFPTGSEDALALVERLLDDVRGERMPGTRRRRAVSADARRRARQRALVGDLLDLPPPGGFFENPSPSELRTRLTRLTLDISLAPTRAKGGVVARALMHGAGTAFRRGQARARSLLTSRRRPDAG